MDRARLMQDIDFKRLRYFSRIALDGSLTKAAGVLGIAQPALSRQMHVLEESLGVQLFQRTARGMRLTQEGDYFLAAIAGPLRDLERAIQNVRSLSVGVAGDFAVGLPPGINDAIGRKLAIEVHDRYPGVRLRLIEGVTGSLQDWLGRGMIDLAVLESPADDSRLHADLVLETTLMLIGPESDVDPDDRPIALAAALDLPLVLPSHHLGIKHAVATAAATAALPLITQYETDSPRLALELVDSGLGHAIMPRLMVTTDDGGKRRAVRPVIGAELHYRLYLTARHARAATASPVDIALRTCIANMISELA